MENNVSLISVLDLVPNSNWRYGMASGLSNWWKKYHDGNFLLVESVIATAIALGFIISSDGRLLENSRPAIYTGLASASASLLGFTLTSLSLTLGFLDRKYLKELCTKVNMDGVYQTFSSTIVLLGCTAICNFFCLTLDTNKENPHWIGLLLFWLVLLSMFRFARCCWIILLLVKVITSFLAHDISSSDTSDSKNTAAFSPSTIIDD